MSEALKKALQGVGSAIYGQSGSGGDGGTGGGGYDTQGPVATKARLVVDSSGPATRTPSKGVQRSLA